MVLKKKVIQREVDATIESGAYTDGFGKICLLIAEVSIHKRGLNYRYNEFEVNYIIKPRIVDMLLLRIFKYNKAEASAYTFISLITSNAITDAIRDIRRAERGESKDVFYIEDVKKEVMRIQSSDGDYMSGEVYLEDGIIKLN